MLRPIDRENFGSQLQSFSIRAIVQNMIYLACKANEIVATVNELLEREKERSAETEQFTELSPCPVRGAEEYMTPTTIYELAPCELGPRKSYYDLDGIRLVFEEGQLVGWYRPGNDEGE